jgi:hypothetical protein
MSRITAALLAGWLSLCVLYNGTGIAVATEHANHIPFLLVSNHIEDAQKGAGTQAETKKTVEKPVKAPARQVPVEPIDEPAGDEAGKESGKPSRGGGKKKAADKPSGEPDEKASKKATGKSTGSPAVKGKKDKPVKAIKKPVKERSSAEGAEMTVPGLPVRKPRKPVFRNKKDTKKAMKKPAPPSNARDKKLCKALQKCRNAFVKCKSKIKHPDQSEPWIIAKEVCGDHYKTCIEKDFQDGEWFMTRWFYFQELNCGE